MTKAVKIMVVWQLALVFLLFCGYKVTINSAVQKSKESSQMNYAAMKAEIIEEIYRNIDNRVYKAISNFTHKLED